MPTARTFQLDVDNTDFEVCNFEHLAYNSSMKSYLLNKEPSDLPTTAGVYAISRNQPDEAGMTPMYVGSTKNFKKRVVEAHRPDLRRNAHYSKSLQEAYNEHPDEFIVTILEETEPIRKIYEAREQYYLDTLQPFQKNGRGFNIAEQVGRLPSWKGKKQSPEHLAKRAVVGNKWNLGRKQTPEEIERRVSQIRGRPSSMRGFKHSEETKAKLSAQRMGHRNYWEGKEHYKHTEEAKAKISAANKGTKKSLESLARGLATKRRNYQLEVFWCA